MNWENAIALTLLVHIQDILQLFLLPPYQGGLGGSTDNSEEITASTLESSERLFPIHH
jgi:hypothetical protein